MTHDPSVLRPFLSARIGHEYFGDADSGLRFVPTEETKKTLKNGGTVVKPTDSDTMDAFAQGDAGGIGPLRFWLVPELAEFWALTGLDVGRDECLLFANGGAEADSKIKPVTLPMRRAPELALVPWLGATGAAEGSANGLRFDAAGLAEARYRVEVGGASVDDFVLSDGLQPGPRIFVELIPGSSPLTLMMPSRRCRLRYIVRSNSGQDLSEARITGRMGATFGSPMRQTVNGQDVWVFETTESLPLLGIDAQQSAPVLNGPALVENGVHLPLPAAGSIRVETADGSKMYWAEMHVSL